MVNRHRGDVALELAGETVPLRLTLGALAEIEAAFGAADLSGLGERLSSGRLSARDLIAVLAAAARGGGGRLADADFAARVGASEIPACVAAFAELIAVTFGDAA